MSTHFSALIYFYRLQTHFFSDKMLINSGFGVEKHQNRIEIMFCYWGSFLFEIAYIMGFVPSELQTTFYL